MRPRVVQSCNDSEPSADTRRVLQHMFAEELRFQRARRSGSGGRYRLLWSLGVLVTQLACRFGQVSHC